MTKNKWRDDGKTSQLYHKKGGLLLQQWAPNHVGETYHRSEGVWHNNRNYQQKIDTPYSRSATPIDETLRNGYDGIAEFFRFGDAKDNSSPELIPYMVRFSKHKGANFIINCPRKGDLTKKQAPLGLAPFPEEYMLPEYREEAEIVIETYIKWIGGPFVLIHLVGPSIDEVQWLWIRRVYNIPIECFSIYSVKGAKRNRILVRGHKEYTLVGSDEYSCFGKEPEHSIIEILTPPQGYESHGSLYYPKELGGKKNG